MVKRTRVLAALAAVGLAPVTMSTAQTQDPRIGHWVQQPGPRSVGLHVAYEELGEGRFRLTFGPHYVPLHQQILDGKCDGGIYPWVDGTGTPSGNTLSCRFTGPRTVEYVYTRGDKTIWATSTGVETVSEDGSTLAWDAIHRDTNGGVVEELHSRFSRRDDEPSRN
jgi:hypothetical protein